MRSTPATRPARGRSMRVRRGSAAWAVTVCLVALSVWPAAAVTPDTGPTAGGTVVAGTVAPLAFTVVAAGLNHSAAIGSDHNTYAWGGNALGQLGDGTTTSSATPVRVQAPAGVDFVSVSVGVNHSVALGSDGNAYAWGDNSHGQLGDGGTAGSRVPVRVRAPAGVTFTALVTGVFHSVAIGSDGNAYAWGRNTYGELGDGTTTSSATPVVVQVPAGVSFTSLAAGVYHSVAIGSDGVSYAWGDNGFGQLGDGTTVASHVPVPVQAPPGVTFTAIAAGVYHVVATGSDGNTYSWGANTSGQLGDGTTTGSPTPVPVQTPAGVTFTGPAAAGGHSLALGSDGATYAWGDGDLGQLGDGTTTDSLTPVPVQAPPGVTFTGLAAGGGHSIALGSDGNAYAWGDNGSGGLGDGTTTNSSTPVRVADDLAVVAVTFGTAAAAALSQSGTTWSATTPAQCGVVDVQVTSTRYGVTRTASAGTFGYGSAPAVTAQPTSVELPPGGGQVTLSAQATGDDVPTVQWQSAPSGTAGWTDIPGATSSTLTTTITQPSDLRAVFTNCRGSAVTVAVTVTVAALDPSSGPTSTPEPSRTADGSGTVADPGTELAATGPSGIGTLLAVAVGLVVLGTGVLVAWRASHTRARSL